MSAPLDWLRTFTLSIGKGGQGVAFSSAPGNDLHVTFEIEKTALSTPNKAKLSLFNLAPNTETLISNVFDQVVLTAGYGGQNSLLFSGEIATVNRKNTPPDVATELEAADGGFDYYKATVAATIAAGTDHNAVVAAAIASFTTVKPGQTVVSAQGTRTRGKVLSGATRDVLTAMAADLNAHWSIQNGQLVVCDVASHLPTPQIPLITGGSTFGGPGGMIGQVEITEAGIKVKTHLRPFEIGTLFEVRARTATTSTKQKKGQISSAGTSLFRQSPSGVYKVTKVKHTGDTRGDSWLTEVEGVRI